MSLQFINIPPATGETPTGLIILLHGWGANCQDLASLIPFLQLHNYQFLCPDAPFPHPYQPGGKMWYNLEFEDVEGLEKSQKLLKDWLISLENTTNVPLSRTILSGFSQGGAMTLDVGLSLPLAGLVSMSGYLHSKPQLLENHKLPVLIMHGRQDPIVPLSAAHQARSGLTALGLSVQYQEFNMGHEIQPEEINLMRDFISNAIG